MAKTKRVQKKRVSKRRYSRRKNTRKHSRERNNMRRNSRCKYSRKINTKRRNFKKNKKTHKRKIGGGIIGVADYLSKRQSPRWVRSNETSGCQICDKEFGMLTRKHHCRRCGMAVCDSCSRTRIILNRWLTGGEKPHLLKDENSVVALRVCDYCAAFEGGITKEGVIEYKIVKEDIHTSGRGLAFKDDDGIQTGTRVPHGTNVIAFLKKPKKNFKVGRRNVEYTLVFHEGNLGYIASNNLFPPVASGTPGSALAAAPGSVLASAPVAASVPSLAAAGADGTTKNVKFYSNQLGVAFEVKGYGGKIVNTQVHTIDTFHETFETKTDSNYDFLEQCHNYIQWLFPTKTRSRYNPHCSPLTNEDIDYFKSDQHIMNRLHTSFEIIADFYGFVCDEDGNVSVGNGAHYVARMKAINNPDDHNFQRISRILECLGLMGLFNHRQSFHEALTKAVTDGVLDNGHSALPRWTEKMAIA